MTEDKTATTPAVRVNFDLDEVERPKHRAERPPYAFGFQGRVITLTDPEELEWSEVMAATGNPATLLQLAMTRKDLRFLEEHRVPIWRMTKLAEDYMQYYDLEDLEGNDD